MDKHSSLFVTPLVTKKKVFKCWQLWSIIYFFKLGVITTEASALVYLQANLISVGKARELTLERSTFQLLHLGRIPHTFKH
jgi:hypothetical protein